MNRTSHFHSPRLRLMSLALVWCCLLGGVRPGGAQPSGGASDAAKVTGIASQLVCDCPTCGKQAVDQCHPGCAQAEKYKAAIAAQLQQSKSREQILNAMADTYGEHLLGDPRPRGFARWASLGPLLALGLGLAVLVAVLRAPRSGARPKSSAPATPKDPDEDYEDPRVAQALRDFDD